MPLLFKKLLKEFVYGGHLLSLGAASIVWATLVLAQTSVKDAWPILALAYLSSQIVYNHDHLDEINDEFANAERTKHLRDTRNYQIASLVVYILLFLATSLFTSLPAALLAAFIVFGGVFYTKKAKKFTKKVVGFKNIYIAFFWSILAFFVPFHYLASLRSNIFIFFGVFIFIRWIINSAFFDLKDLKEDKDKGLKTLPAYFGFAGTIFYLHIFNVISGVIVVLLSLFEILPRYSLILLIFPLYSYYYLRRAPSLDEKQLRTISYVMVDGEYFLWPIALLIGRAFVI